jgi:hypothetical protein
MSNFNKIADFFNVSCIGQYKFSLSARYKKGSFHEQYYLFSTMKSALRICKKLNDKNNDWEWRIIHI